MPAVAASPRSYYRSLDGLRAAAALIVMLAHGGAPYPLSGGAGVDLFFVLSGFLITTILAAEHARRGTIGVGAFYARRFLRLVPCLVLTSAAFAALTWRERGEIPGRQLLLALTYTANWARAAWSFDMAQLGHCWSLAIEEQFYLVWPFAILLLERRRLGDARNAALLCAAALLLAGYRAALTGTFGAERIYFGLDTHMDGLVLGSALAYGVRTVHAHGGLSDRASRWLGRIATPLAVALIVAIMGTITWADAPMGLFGYLAVAIAAAVVVADLVLGRHSLLTAPLARRLPVYLGRISYGLYLWHYPLFHAIDGALPGRSITVLLPLKFAATLVVAAASFHLVEVRFLRLKGRFAARADAPVRAEPA